MKARVEEAAKEEKEAIKYAREMVIHAEECARRADDAEDRDARVLLRATSEFLATVLKKSTHETKKQQQQSTLSKLAGATIGLLPGVSLAVAASKSQVPVRIVFFSLSHTHTYTRSNSMHKYTLYSTIITQ